MAIAKKIKKVKKIKSLDDGSRPVYTERDDIPPPPEETITEDSIVDRITETSKNIGETGSETTLTPGTIIEDALNSQGEDKKAPVGTPGDPEKSPVQQFDKKPGHRGRHRKACNCADCVQKRGGFYDKTTEKTGKPSPTGTITAPQIERKMSGDIGCSMANGFLIPIIGSRLLKIRDIGACLLTKEQQSDISNCLPDDNFMTRKSIGNWLLALLGYTSGNLSVQKFKEVKADMDRKNAEIKTRVQAEMNNIPGRDQPAPGINLNEMIKP